MTAPATLFARQFDPEALRIDATVGSAIGRQIASTHSALSSWVNVPLINSTGHRDDLDLRLSDRQKETIYAAQLPGTMAIVECLRSLGFFVEHARIAILSSRDLLRPHVDMHHSVRLLVQLNAHGLDFRHVFGNYCVAMRTGELWGVDGSICHGAANLASSQDRVMLIVDCRPDRIPAWYSAPWNIPLQRVLSRKAWNQESRLERTQHAVELAREQGNYAAEKEWLLVPYEYDLEPHAMYSELIDFCEHMASAASVPTDYTLWAGRARYWRAHNCVCVSTDNLVWPEVGSRL